MNPRRMKMKNDIYKILSEEFPSRHFVRIGDNKHICLYVGKDDDARYSFDFRGNFVPSRIPSSDVIDVGQYKNDNEYTLRFSLENRDLLEYFCIFCQDLLESTKAVIDDATAYKTLRSRYFSWRQLFKPDKGRLTEAEIMGLIGELLFLQSQLFPQKGIDGAIESWTGNEKTHKDFSFDDVWYEIKAINFGKESVRIASIEQLDSDVEGHLVVYTLEKMSPNFNGIKLNQLVSDIISQLENATQRELFMEKLNLYGFDFSPEYDQWVYSLHDVTMYKVAVGAFPRIVREMIPDAVTKVTYEIIISEIQDFKE
ncbi:Putative PD-(D/E)XK family member [Prevotella sp. khp1]|nr:Putative PD-(D/E)XK family member [Prevotella sp. khp1]